MSHETIFVTLTDEESRIRREGGVPAAELMKRKYEECHALQSQSGHENVTVILKTADGEQIEAFNDGTPEDYGSDDDAANVGGPGN